MYVIYGIKSATVSQILEVQNIISLVKGGQLVIWKTAFSLSLSLQFKSHLNSKLERKIQTPKYTNEV